MVENGASAAARFQSKVFIFSRSSSVYLHCRVNVCLQRGNDECDLVGGGYCNRNQVILYLLVTVLTLTEDWKWWKLAFKTFLARQLQQANRNLWSDQRQHWQLSTRREITRGLQSRHWWLWPFNRTKTKKHTAGWTPCARHVRLDYSGRYDRRHQFSRHYPRRLPVARRKARRGKQTTAVLINPVLPRRSHTPSHI